MTGFVAMLVSFALAVYGVLLPRSADSLDLALAGMIAGLAALALTSWSVRCPSCSAHWMWTAWQEQDCMNWMKWLLAQCVCPRCGEHADHH
ncbi:MAG: hypothetical protein JWN04_4002 [Myxococcaceae bacterium]|nr:hypothetical protein [Myxococcaceae bacterium]